MGNKPKHKCERCLESENHLQQLASNVVFGAMHGKLSIKAPTAIPITIFIIV